MLFFSAELELAAVQGDFLTQSIGEDDYSSEGTSHVYSKEREKRGD